MKRSWYKKKRYYLLLVILLFSSPYVLAFLMYIAAYQRALQHGINLDYQSHAPAEIPDHENASLFIARLDEWIKQNDSYISVDSSIADPSGVIEGISELSDEELAEMGEMSDEEFDKYLDTMTDFPTDEEMAEMTDEELNQYFDTMFDAQSDSLGEDFEAAASILEDFNALELLENEQVQSLKRGLEPYADIRKQFTEGDALTTARYPADYTLPPTEVEVPNFLVRQNLSKLLSLDALVAVSDNDSDGAYLAIERQFKFSGWCFDEAPNMISKLIGISVLGNALNNLSYALWNIPPTEMQKQSILKVVNTIDLDKQITEGFHAEAAFTDWAMEYTISEESEESLSSKMAFYTLIFFFRANRAAALSAAVDNLQFIGKHPFEYRGKSETNLPSWAFLANLAAIDTTSYLYRNSVEDAKIRMAKIALEFSNPISMTYPKSQNEFDALQIPVDTTDPFSGEPFRLQSKDGAILLYSIGPDFIDNETEFVYRGNLEEPGDVVWRIK